MTTASRRWCTGLARCVLTAVLLAPLIAGCAATPWAPREGVVPLAKADGWRAGLVDSFDDDHPFALVEIAYDRETAERAWAENVPDGLPARRGRPNADGRYGDLDQVDFDTHALVVWSSGQSGSCPGWPDDIRGGSALEVDTAQQGRFCTDDYSPYRMVLAVDRDRLPQPEELPVSDVIVDGRTSGWQSLADASPAAG